jgi:hypothetical protein
MLQERGDMLKTGFLPSPDGFFVRRATVMKVKRQP